MVVSKVANWVAMMDASMVAVMVVWTAVTWVSEKDEQ